ncbi:hypothetical protein GJ496_002831 [Pomphorhynchus laevis]|nr:hypothetical protein GJ496_002831 [Pomphorhynchus laevis]
MPFNYATLLSLCKDKGICGLPEYIEENDSVLEKVRQLKDLIQRSKYTVMITGAGISTSVGILDFRGPNGIWTNEEKLQFTKSHDMDGAIPSYTHFAIRAMTEKELVDMTISQNVDGLHLKSGLNKSKLIELHGNMYIEKCDRCSNQRERKEPVPSIGFRKVGTVCGANKFHGQCRGIMHDVVLDWDTDIDSTLLSNARLACQQADLVICVGTSLRMMPCGKLPLLGKTIVIINLQETLLDQSAYMIIRQRCDQVFSMLLSQIHCPVNLGWYCSAIKERPKKILNSSLQTTINANLPMRMYILSGKRKCGKDFIAKQIENILPAVYTLRISKPLKEEYAIAHKLNISDLLDSTEYKERYRADMVAYGENIRNKDSEYFCRKVVEEAETKSHPIWLLTDARRKSDLKFFSQLMKHRLVTIRIFCDDTCRSRRRWKLDPIIDFSETECNLDDVNFDWYIENDDSKKSLFNINEELTNLLRNDLYKIGLTFTKY